MKPHKSLVAWRKGMELVFSMYRITGHFPKEETYGLSSQLRRASVSVPSNIAEGAAGRSKEQFRNYLSIAIGSLNEIDTQVEIAFALGYLSNEEFFAITRIVDECLAVTYGLRRSVKV